ncbi:hypothetical protein DQ04_21361000, partial [Trypanosoma grayi]|uniref:hypothetical protein n=1 Tax=Trypanosoma grayi TaxID=71804 RepID=UPI0004F3F753
RHLLPLLALALCCTSLCAAAGDRKPFWQMPSRFTTENGVKRKLTDEEYYGAFLRGRPHGARDYEPRHRIMPLFDERYEKPNATELSAEDAKDVFGKSSLVVSKAQDGKKKMDKAVKTVFDAMVAAENALSASTLVFATAVESVNKLKALIVLPEVRGQKPTLKQDPKLKEEVPKIIQSINKTSDLFLLAIANFSEVKSKTTAAEEAPKAGIEQVQLTLADVRVLKKRFGAAFENTTAAEDNAEHAIIRAKNVLGPAVRARRNTIEAERFLREAVGNMTFAYGYTDAADPTRTTQTPKRDAADMIGKALYRMRTTEEEARKALEMAKKAFDDAMESLIEARAADMFAEGLEEYARAVQKAAVKEMKKHGLEKDVPKELLVEKTKPLPTQETVRAEGAGSRGTSGHAVDTPSASAPNSSVR